MKKEMMKNAALLLMAVLYTGSVALAQEFRPDGDTVVASRGGQDLLFKDVDIMIDDLDPSIRSGYMDSPERIDRTLNGLLLARQVAAEARKSGLDENKVFKRRMLLAQDAVLMKMQIEAYLDALPQPDFTQLARERYMANNGPDLVIPEMRDVSSILISTDTRTEEAALELAESVRQRIVEGADFGEMARTYSDDNKGSQATNDLLGSQFWRIQRLTKGKVEKPFEDAVWAMSIPGELADLVKTRYGYHIVRLDGITPAIKRPFEDVGPRIIYDLKASWREEQRQKYLDGFKAHELIADPETVRSLRTRYMPQKAGVSDDGAAAAK